MGVDSSSARFPWDDARYFLAAYRAGSLLQAAKALGVSHSTVRRRLSGLERSLGVKLFTPTGEGLLPTDAAHTAFVLAERIEETVAGFGDRLLGETRELTGSLIISTVDAMAGLLGPVVTAFCDRNPKVTVVLNTDNRPLDLGRREADIAVRITNEPDEDLFGRKIGAVEYGPFASPALIDRCGSAFDDLPWILYDHSAEATQTEAWFIKNVRPAAPPIRVTHTSSMLALASAGVGAAVLPERCGQAAGLTSIGDTIAGFRTDVWCLCHRDLRMSDRVRSFMGLAADLPVLERPMSD